ncbi:hypothetical protein Trydic_g17198 [Trypoxylus dichotomus]
MLRVILEIGIFAIVSAIFPPGNNVVHLSKESFESTLLRSSNVWIVMFYSPSCGYCHQFAPEYAKASLALKGVVRVGAVNAVQEKELAEKYRVNGFPTIKMFIINKKKPEEFHGERNAKTLAKAAMSAIQRLINYQLNGKPDKGPAVNLKNVVKLTESNFKNIVLASNDIWMINFYAPLCQICLKFEPIWAEAATRLKGKVRFGAIDVSVNKAVAEKYSVTTYPTVKYFPFDLKGEIFDYKEPKKLDSILQFATKLFTESLPPPENKQLTNNTIFKEACIDKTLCVISFLPHLLDCQSKCRRSYLKILIHVGEKFKGKEWGWLWSEAGAQENLERNIDIGGFGYPAMVVVSLKKKVYSVLHGAFSEEGITEFLRALSYGRSNIDSLKSEIILRDIDLWDGQDAVIPLEQEYKENEDVQDEDFLQKDNVKAAEKKSEHDEICLKETCDRFESEKENNDKVFKCERSSKRYFTELASNTNTYQAHGQCIVR